MYPKLRGGSARLMSKDERRKVFKPIVEKRRRDRINGCLEEIKDQLRHHGIRREGMCFSKVEKADILEMAVEYLHMLRSHQMHAIATHPELLLKYQSGFSECAAAVSQFMSATGMSSLNERVMRHLASVVCRVAPNKPGESGGSDATVVTEPGTSAASSGGKPETKKSTNIQVPIPVKAEAKASSAGLTPGTATVSMKGGTPLLLCKPIPIFPDFMMAPYAAGLAAAAAAGVVWRPF